MHTAVQFLLQGAVGFAIGAGTNDLAIRWVFWALFAKKKREIADAVQEVVSRELMSPDKIVARLAAPEVAASLRHTAQAALEQAAERPWPSLQTLAREYAGLPTEAFQTQLAGLASKLLADRIASPAFRAEVLRPFLAERWQALAGVRTAGLLPAVTRDLLAALPDRLAETLLAPVQRERLCAAIAEGLRAWMAGYPTPASFLGPNTLDELAALVGSRTPLLVDELAGLLAMPPAQETLRVALRDAVQTRLASQGALGSLLSGLSGTAVVEHQLGRFCETLPASLRTRFASADDRARMRGLIEVALRKLLARSWDDLLDTRTPGVIERHVRALLGAEALRDIVRQGFARITASVLDSLQRGTLADAAGLLTADGDVTAYLDWLADTLHAALLASDIRPRLEHQTFEAVSRLCASPIRPLKEFLPDDTIPRLAELIAEQALAFVRDNVAELVERTRIWDTISESIIVYDDKKMEAIARSVANRELRWVTLLGGVIGFVVGIAQGVLLLILNR
jgi:uncharacterized membrane-anchored protein YjiN (DUF445 family)